MAILFSLCSLGFAGFNDMLFRRYGQTNRPVGLFVALIGVVWAGFFAALGWFKGSLALTVSALAIGSVAGVCSATSNLIFIEAMKRTGAGIGATIYRLNLVFVAILAAVFLNESFTFIKVLGLAMAVGTVLLLTAERDAGARAVGRQFILLLVAASFLRACMGIAYKVASNHGTSNEAFLLINGIYWVLFGALYAWLVEKETGIDRHVCGYSILSGALVCGIVLFLRLAVNAGDASMTVTISQLSFLVTIPCAVCFLNESVSFRKMAAVGLAVLCILCFAMA